LTNNHLCPILAVTGKKGKTGPKTTSPTEDLSPFLIPSKGGSYMKGTTFAVCTVVLVLAASVLAQLVVKPKMGSVEQELIKLENDWADAWAKHDVAFFERIESDDYTWTSPEGEVWTKARDLAFVKSLDSVKDITMSYVTTEVKVRVYGDAAVLTGLDTIKETNKGKEVNRQERWTNTWVKRAGQWQCVAGHSSEIAQK
jgi:ketosteroid isomerase-like protein